MEYINPDEIEKRSFEIIQSELPHPLDPVFAPIIMRVIHTTADFEYADSISFSDGAAERALTALRQGVHLVSDTNMVKAGVDKMRLAAFASKIHCFTGDEDTAVIARRKNITRSKAAMDKAAAMNERFIFVIGNAPTALMRICELKALGKISPEFVIGVPVGFVNAAESKEMLMRSGIPYITSRGRKGGSNVAAAICNALLRMAEQENLNV